MTPRQYVLDGPGGQVRVEEGVGRLVAFDPHKTYPHYVRVTLAVPMLATPVSGWADSRVEPFATLFADGRGAAAIALVDVDVAYRIEVSRHRGINPAIPLEDVRPRDKTRRVVELRPAGDEPHAQHDEPPTAADPPAVGFFANLATLLRLGLPALGRARTPRTLAELLADHPAYRARTVRAS